MGPFRRSKRELQAPLPTIDVQVDDASYRRLGDAMATVVITLDEAPPDDARLTVSTESATICVEPMMVTRELPGTKSETHRMWFAVELSAVMFGDGYFAIQTGEGSAPLPHPSALPAWGVSEPEEAGAPIPALAESSLRAAVSSLEARVREAESANAELTADAQRLSQTVAATLAEVQREREQLLAQLAEATAPEVEADDSFAAEREPASPPSPSPYGFLKRLQAARGAAAAES